MHLSQLLLGPVEYGNVLVDHHARGKGGVSTAGRFQRCLDAFRIQHGAVVWAWRVCEDLETGAALP